MICVHHYQRFYGENKCDWKHKISKVLKDEVSFELNVRSSARAQTPENKLSSWFQHEPLRLNNYVYSM